MDVSSSCDSEPFEGKPSPTSDISRASFGFEEEPLWLCRASSVGSEAACSFKTTLASKATGAGESSPALGELLPKRSLL